MEKLGSGYSLYSLVADYNNAKNGRYRIIKNISLCENHYDLVAEFEVK